MDDQEKKEAIKAAIIKRQVELVNQYGRPVSMLEVAEYVGISYPSLVQIANGVRLPAWENLVKLGRKWPEIMRIMDVPALLPDVSGADRLMQNYEKLSPEKRERLLAVVEKMLAENGTAENPAAQASA